MNTVYGWVESLSQGRRELLSFQLFVSGIKTVGLGDACDASESISQPILCLDHYQDT
jgi:hypothetical protein